MFIEYFNIIRSGAPGGSTLLSISLSVIISSLLYFRFRLTMVRFVKIIPLLTLISIVGIIINKSIVNKEYYTLKDIVINKQHSVTEGYVTEFTINENDKSESFYVNSHNFLVTENKSDGAFHELSSSGGPIRNGSFIRLFHYEGKILALWIKE